MKRGLKRQVRNLFGGVPGVEESSPMKRGLKRVMSEDRPISCIVEESSPMKRGLKLPLQWPDPQCATTLKRVPR